MNAARLAVAAPWVVVLLLATRPESLAAYDRPEGAAVLACGGACTVLAYRVTIRIARPAGHTPSTAPSASHILSQPYRSGARSSRAASRSALYGTNISSPPWKALSCSAIIAP